MAVLFVADEYTIVPITDPDIPAILEVYVQCEDFLSLGPVPKASLKMVRDDIDHSIESNGVFCGVWDRDRKMVGILDFIPEAAKETADLSLLMIGKEYRHGGVGRKTVSALERYLKEKYGTTVVRSGVQYNNPIGIRFWKKLDFIIDEGEAIDFDDGTTAYRMYKNI